MSRRPPTWVLAYLVLAVVWGCSFAFVQVGLRSLTPVQVAFGRLFLGALALLLLSAVLRQRLPRRRRTWGHLLVVGAVLNAVPFTLFAVGQQHVSSILAGIINAATPLTTLAVILAAYPEEQPTRRRVLGLLMGFLGVAVVLGVWEGFAAGQWSGVLACLGAVTCYGIGLPYSRRHLTGSGEGPVALATGQVSMGCLLMVPVLLVAGVAPHAPVTATVVWAMVALGAVGSGFAFVLNFHVIKQAGPSTASTVTYLTPLVAAVVGIAVLGEGISWHEPVGGLIVLAGVAVAQSRRAVASVAAIPAAPAPPAPAGPGPAARPAARAPGPGR
ncbi:DMT family transporter [Actinotalea sp. BY-33]|uniref:DMT family transporter n=1 Tax=Actinotalea soli TaxID=2819234 RepID=A0A939LRN5_9CELL|nr:DMT family transporter [Actinotalea soli]MBO1752598.1 DMT family transporter [Actinotalea soli]